MFILKNGLLLFCVMVGFNITAQQTNFNNMPYHLLGMWVSKSNDSTFRFEYWEMHDDSTFQGMGGKVKGRDTTYKETLWLEWRMGRLYYLANAEGQNGDKYITFRCTGKTGRLNVGETLVFSNPKHDFPQNIKYKLEAKRKLYVEVNAVIKGKKQSHAWHFEKKTH